MKVHKNVSFPQEDSCALSIIMNFKMIVKNKKLCNDVTSNIEKCIHTLIHIVEIATSIATTQQLHFGCLSVWCSPTIIFVQYELVYAMLMVGIVIHD